MKNRKIFRTKKIRSGFFEFFVADRGQIFVNELRARTSTQKLNLGLPFVLLFGNKMAGGDQGDLLSLIIHLSSISHFGLSLPLSVHKAFGTVTVLLAARRSLPVGVR